MGLGVKSLLWFVITVFQRSKLILNVENNLGKQMKWGGRIFEQILLLRIHSDSKTINKKRQKNIKIAVSTQKR